MPGDDRATRHSICPLATLTPRYYWDATRLFHSITVIDVLIPSAYARVRAPRSLSGETYR